MAKDHFNEFKYRKIINIKDIKPFLAEQLFIEYVDEYPDDYYARCSYIDQLTTINKLEEARKELNDLVDTISKDGYYMYVEKEKMHKFKYKLKYTMVRLLMYEENYHEALKQIMDYKNKYIEGVADFELAKYICLRNLNKLDQTKINNITYVVYQMLNYSEEALLNHLKCHFTETSIKKEEKDSFFTYDFPINDIIEEVKKYIPSEKATLNGIGDSNYFFKYDSCGRYGRKTENFFKVVCFYKTNRIITIYPIDYGEDLPYVDLNYMNKKEEIFVDERKNNDQISKFYKRLSKKKPSN